jgi:mannosyltransferase OCH1-like enzyme
VEKIIHQIWIGDKEMPIREKEYVSQVKDMNPDFTQMLWYDDNIPEMPTEINDLYHKFKNAGKLIFCADILRHVVVNKYGGIYCDVDFKPLQPLSVYELENYDMLLHHGGNEDLTVSNSLFGFSANNELSNYIVESITKDRIGGYYPQWFGRKIKNFYGLEYNDLTSELEKKIDKTKSQFIYVRDLEKVMLHYGLYSWSNENVVTYKTRQEKNPFTL